MKMKARYIILTLLVSFLLMSFQGVYAQSNEDYLNQLKTLDRDSFTFYLAKKMLWDPDGFPERFIDERVQFMKFYQWLSSDDNMEISVDVSIDEPTNPDADTMSIEKRNFQIINDTDDPIVYVPAEKETVEITDTVSVTKGKTIGGSHSITAGASVLVAKAKTTHTINWEVRTDTTKTNTKKTTKEFSWNLQNVTCRPGKTLNCEMEITRYSPKRNMTMNFVAKPVSGRTFTVVMGYGSWKIDPASREYTNGITWKKEKLTDDDLKFTWSGNIASSIASDASVHPSTVDNKGSMAVHNTTTIAGQKTKTVRVSQLPKNQYRIVK